MSRIAGCVIAYNSEAKIRTLLDSLRGHIDVLVLGIDAKTTDKTREVAEAWAKKTKTEIVVKDFVLEDGEPAPEAVKRGYTELPKNFAKARNETWACIPQDCEWGFWIDTDDRLASDVNLHEIAKKVGPEVNQVWLQYAYFRDAHGNVTTTFWRERLIRLSAKHKWIRRLHEINVTDPATRADDERAWIEHVNRTEDPEKGSRNFATLYKIIEENPNDEWAWMYLGLQHFGALQWDDATQCLLRFVRMTKDIGERWHALVICAKAFRSAGKHQESLNCAVGAIREVPEWADPYYEMAYTYQAMSEYGRAIQWYESGLKKDIPNDRRLLFNPLDYDFNPCVTIHTSYAVRGELEKARELLDRAITIRPEPELLAVRKLYDRTLSRREAITAGLTLAKHLYQHGEPEKAVEVMKALPAGSDQETRSVGQAKVALATELSYTQTDSLFENRYFLEMETAEPDTTKPTPEEEWLLRRLQTVGAKRVLDIGIGNAQTALFLAEHGIHVVGLDVDPRRVKNANLQAVKRGYVQKRYSRAHGRSVPVLERHKKTCAPTCAEKEHLLDLAAQFWYGRAEKLPDKVRNLGPYDAVLLDGVLNRVRDPKAAIAQAETVSQRVLITVPDGGSIHTQHPGGSLRAYERTELEGMFVGRGRITESHQITDSLLCVEYTLGTEQYQPPVVFFCGPGWEPWGPDQIDGKGLGGSETAVVRLAESLVRRGMRVMVYAEAEGTWNGVNYRKFDKWNPLVPVWMFVAWRQPTVFDQQINADHKVLWMHDVDAGDVLTEARAGKIDTLWCMSRFHRSHLMQKYPFLIDEQMCVVGNGIETSRFDGEAERDNAIIYSSSPDRGLLQVLSYWPEIHEKTGAELRIFYGWENYDLMGGESRSPGFKQQVELLAKQDGVVWKGRVGQRELAREMMKAKALFYPGPHPFEETFCITALEAQAAGCVPVTRDNGALPETNKYGIVLPNDSKPKRWVAAAQEALDATDQTRAKMRQWALGQTWDAVAERVMERSIALDKQRQLQETKSA